MTWNQRNNIPEEGSGERLSRRLTAKEKECGRIEKRDAPRATVLCDPDEFVDRSLSATRRIHAETARESAGQLSGVGRLLRVFIATAMSLGVENELPRAIREESHDGQIVSAETRGRFELFAVLVRSLETHLVEGDLTVLRLGDVRKDAGSDAAQANDMNWLHGVFQEGHSNLGN